MLDASKVLKLQLLCLLVQSQRTEINDLCEGDGNVEQGASA